jgi:DNA-binding XRE family transcriptional regulator
MVYEKLPLSLARKKAGYTQVAFGEAVGVSESTVINWEKGRSEPTVTQAQKCAEVCNRPLDSIIFLPNSAV